MKHVIGFGLFLLLLIGVFILLINGLVKDLNENEKSFKATIGGSVVLNGDTLTVVDYSTWDNTLKLSNGVSVSTEFYNSQKTK